MSITSAVPVACYLASRLDNNLQEFQRSINSGDPEVVGQLFADCGYRGQSPSAELIVFEFEPSLLELLFFQRNHIVKFLTKEYAVGPTTITACDNQFNFTIGPFSTELTVEPGEFVMTVSE